METQINAFPDLSGFTGTEGYHYLNYLRNLKFTDGWNYLANTAKCFWLADIKEKLLYKQKINYTDFPEGTFEWYQVGDVVLLKGEY